MAIPDACDHCGKSGFATNKKLAAHEKRHKPKSKMKPLYHFKCPLCPQTCRLKANLQAHVESQHLDIEQYQCKHCDRCTKTRSGLRSHYTKEHPGMPISCVGYGKKSLPEPLAKLLAEVKQVPLPSQVVQGPAATTAIKESAQAGRLICIDHTIADDEPVYKPNPPVQACIPTKENTNHLQQDNSGALTKNDSPPVFWRAEANTVDAEACTLVK